MRKAFICIILFLVSSVVFADIVVLQSGEKIEGTIFENDVDFIRMDTGMGVDITYFVDEIESINGVAIEEIYKDYFKDQEEVEEEEIEKTDVVIREDSKPQPSFKIEDVSSTTEESVVTHQQGILPVQIEGAKKFIKKTTRLLSSPKRLKAEDLKEIVSQVPLENNNFLIWMLLLWILQAIPLMLIGRKFEDPYAWLAFIPLLHLILIVRISDRPLGTIYLLFIPFLIPIVYVYWWINITKLLNKSPALGVLMIIPGVNIIMLWVLALDKKGQYFGAENDRRHNSYGLEQNRREEERRKDHRLDFKDRRKKNRRKLD